MELDASNFYHHLKTLVGEPEACSFLVTLSGGKDSTVLADLFFRCHLNFDLAHCNFHLRGDDSDHDMKMVNEWAASHCKKLFIKEFDTISLQKNSGKSIEMVARDLRYQWFNELGVNYHYIVTAHHANDNAETLLLNLSRGTGLKGLTGIPGVNEKLLRPLLPFSSEQIEDYAVTNNISYCVDKSNFSEIFNRNKIRLSVIPKLREINPELIDTFSQNIARFKQQYNFYSRQIRLFEQEMTRCEDGICYISIEKLQNNPDSELLLYEFLKKYDFHPAVIHDIIAHLNDEPGKIFKAASYELLKDRKYLIIKRFNERNFCQTIINDVNEFEKHGFSVSYYDVFHQIEFEKDSRILYVDADKFRFPAILRPWQKGDYFFPLGMRGKKKLSDFFVDKKTDLFAKDEIKLLCVDNQIVWIVAQRADDRFKIDENTKHYYKIIYHGRI